MPKRRLAAALLSLAVLLPAATLLPRAAAAGKETIFVLTDPRGDDHGDGSFIYPRRDDLLPGELDLLSLAARTDPEGTEFEATFARYVRPTGRRTIDIGGGNLDDIARFNFYTLNVDIYIDTDRKPGSGNLALLPGRKAETDPANAWEKAIALTPQPFHAQAALRRILTKFAKRDLKAEKGRVESADLKPIEQQIRQDIEGKVFFPTRISVAGPSIRFLVPDAFLEGRAKPEWSYIVAVSGAVVLRKIDVGGTLGIADPDPDSLVILPVALGSHTDRFGTKREDPLQPPLVDIIVPAGMKQEEILRNDDPKAGRPVRIPGVVPAEVRP